MQNETIKVKAWAEGQGDHVVINKSDFDPDMHEMFEPPVEQGLTVKQLKEALTEKGIEFPPTAKKAELQTLLDVAAGA